MIKNEKEVHYLPNWAEQLARLIRTVWLGEDGQCYAPYPPLETAEGWEELAATDWPAGKMLSRFWVSDAGHITATASLVDKGDHWEIGRFNAYEYNPSGERNPTGVTQRLCRDLYSIATDAGWRVTCEATQCHMSSQYIASETLGMRFAGYGFLKETKGVPWDILYFDNHPAPHFKSDREGLIHNVLGIPTMAGDIEKQRLAQIPGIISSTERSSGLPPRKFHILPQYLDHLDSILRMNVPMPARV